MQITSSLFSLSQSLFQARLAPAPQAPQPPQDADATTHRVRQVASETTTSPESLRIREAATELISRTRASGDFVRRGGGDDDNDGDHHGRRADRSRGHHHGHGHERVERQVRHVARDMAHEVRGAFKDLAKGFEGDTRDELEGIGKQFKHDVKDALHGLRHGELDSAGFLAAMESAFSNATTSLDALGAGAEEGVGEEAPASLRIEFASVEEITLSARGGAAQVAPTEVAPTESAPGDEVQPVEPGEPVEPGDAEQPESPLGLGTQLRSFVQSLSERFGVQLAELAKLLGVSDPTEVADVADVAAEEESEVESPAVADTTGSTSFQLAITRYTSFSLTITGDVGSQLDLSS